MSTATNEERTTQFLARDVELPGGGGTFVLITMDNGFDHTKPNTLSPKGLALLEETLAPIRERAGRGEIVGVGITGKPYWFAAGADLTRIGELNSREQVLDLAQLGHRSLGGLATLGVPSFAFVNGPALGGGLEVAINCTYRTVSTGAGALAFPECLLGLIPGWGGAYLAPRLVGVAAALKLIVQNPLEQNRMTKPADAVAMGLADAVFEPALFIEDSLRWAADVLAGRGSPQRPLVDLDDARSWEGACDAAVALLDQRTGGVPPAPYRAVELIRAARTSDRETGFAAEDDAIADMAMTPQFRAGLYAFDLVQRRAKRPAGAPNKELARKVTKIGVVGAGLMASQFSLLFARRLKVPVVMTDLDADRVSKGVGYVHDEIDKLLSKGRIGSDEASRLKGLVTGATDKQAFSDADFVIEAVFEELSVKQQVFAEVEAVVSPECVLATNTSSLSVTAMASAMQHPERLVGFHFFNPVAIMPLLEVIRTEQTDEASLATAFAVGKGLGKTMVLAKDSTSFIVNRLLGIVFDQCARLVDEGLTPQQVDAAMAGIMPMPPFELFDLVGPAIALHNAESLHTSWPDRFGLSPNLERLVQAGVRTFYLPREKGARGERQLDPKVAELLQAPDQPVDLSSDQIQRRVLEPLAREARIMLDDEVVSAPEDLDLAMITGAGYLFWNGGLTPLLDRTGIAEQVTGQRFHPA